MAVEASVRAGEDGGLRAQPLRQPQPALVRQLAARLVAYRGDDPGRTCLQCIEVGLVDGDGAVVQTRVPRASLPTGAELRLGLRPEAVRVADSPATTTGKVELVERLGERALVYARLPDGQPITAEDSAYSRVKIGDEVPLAIDAAAAHVFGPDGTGYHAAAA